ncbi:uncharacterized protein HD556DRAFT_1311416 [Suillus plorans]|uniref:Uncharacterized protein n=1 Tax=Suillus plorans TaxID=116603 RepID=A0A9P7AH65_9AGAM|nr:uncharacterized protein HD556DRAFT_1311416 [Suillus plorans]KAG1789466.1 hypothetical protein HD556DRAFT_1311416 [Suillus plorans]
MSAKIAGLDWQHVYNDFLKLKNSLDYEEFEEKEGSNEPTLGQLVDEMLHLLESKLPKSLTFSDMTMEDLTKLKITCTGFIRLKPNLAERITATTALGQNELWSSVYLSRHLHFLGGHISKTEANARAWIEAFLFRASAMLPSNTCMVLNMKQDVPATIVSLSRLSTLSGIVDYTAIVASQHNANFYVKSMGLYEMKTNMPRSFFVMDAKLCNPSDDVPQAVYKMFAYGKFLEQKVIRGALVNGSDWIFILMTLNDNYDGASYKQSVALSMDPYHTPDDQLVNPELWSDLIAAILAHWIENSFADLGSDDWFESSL